MGDPTPICSVYSSFSARAGSMRYSEQYLARMQAIKQHRINQKRKLELDVTENRAAGRSMIFPNTRHMDLLPPAKRGFDVFLTDNFNSVKNQNSSNTSASQHDLNATYFSDDDTVFRLKGPRGLFSDSNKNALAGETSQSSGIGYSAVYRDEQKGSQPYHLILDVHVHAMSGDQTPIWRFRGIISTTSDVTRFDLCNALYTQLSLPRRLFSIKIVNKRDSGLKSYRFQSQIQGGNHLDMSSLSWCLCASTRIEVSFVETDKDSGQSNERSPDESSGEPIVAILKIGGTDSDDEIAPNSQQPLK
jgi:hypothetical protein